MTLKALQESAEKNAYVYDKVDGSILEVFDLPLMIRNSNMRIHIEIPEFTSLCPKTGQPDFATIVIDYVPDKVCIESKSLKLYMMGYRNTGMFHEQCVAMMLRDLVNALNPSYLEIEGRFTPRGGIPFWPKATYQVM